MTYATQLDLDLSALPADDFDVVDEDVAVESLTAGSPRACGPCTR